MFFKRIENFGDGVKNAYDMPNVIVSFVEIDGDDYTVNFSVPLQDIGYSKEKGILFNAYRIDTDGGEMGKHLFAASPTMSGTFHKPEFFIEL